MRNEWTDLPVHIREVVEVCTGPITEVRPAVKGNHADIASMVAGPQGRVFVKAARKLAVGNGGPEVRSLRWEAAINPHVTEFAPRLLWVQESGEWLALGFEYLEGRHADFSPGSPDLEILAKVVEDLQARPCPGILDNKQVERRWEMVVDDASPMTGDVLLHADLNPANFLITSNRVAMVDWAFVARGAAWVEVALVIPWLLQAEAEAWAARLPAWVDADPGHLDLFAKAFADKWDLNLQTNTEPWAVQHAAYARAWARHRGCGA
ncbi:phosphotransferase [Actinomadura macrotermitis]|uniref:Aminoglycoside phosphotransferase domain-containing protein n=1 Tax=Actinomadura macrotermitis TaxID=2585200 RepID=A0A7K0BTT1_9ACTN|nr:phosphotransferase [Actinomadura macrotermitis]MQY04595.1 hypothetical protein [Actinomadura macrotermitis]